MFLHGQFSLANFFNFIRQTLFIEMLQTIKMHLLFIQGFQFMIFLFVEASSLMQELFFLWDDHIYLYILVTSLQYRFTQAFSEDCKVAGIVQPFWYPKERCLPLIIWEEYRLIVFYYMSSYRLLA